MKEKIDFYFFCLYNYFYRDGISMRTRENGRVASESRASLVFASLVTLGLLNVRVLLKLYVSPEVPAIVGETYLGLVCEIGVLVIIYLAFYKRYISNGYYVDLYNRHKVVPYIRQAKFQRIIIALFVLLLILLFIGLLSSKMKV